MDIGLTRTVDRAQTRLELVGLRTAQFALQHASQNADARRELRAARALLQNVARDVYEVDTTLRRERLPPGDPRLRALRGVASTMRQRLAQVSADAERAERRAEALSGVVRSDYRARLTEYYTRSGFGTPGSVR